jgi:hypothetical protein
LSVSAPAEITRVMVGRVELVTPEQRDYLRQIAQISTNVIAEDATHLHANYYGRAATNANELNRVNAGSESLRTYGVSVPRSYQLYLALGRFRNALILEEARKRPAPGLNSFISTYRLEGYKMVEISAADPVQKE